MLFNLADAPWPTMCTQCPTAIPETSRSEESETP